MKLRKLILTLIFSLFTAATVHAQVVINEIMASNATTQQDACGNYEDWIELYNNSASTINLGGYYIFDDTNFWTFPNTSNSQILPDGYLIIWANDGGCALEPMSALFKLSSSGETVTLRNSSFQIVDEVTYPTATTDESYGRYPNGTGSFERMPEPTFSGENVSTNIPLNPDAACININEVVTSNVSGIMDEDMEASDWIEFKNVCPGTTVDMAGLRISDNSKQWIFPSVLVPPQTYLFVWASDKNRTGEQLHTNFKLSSAGELLTLYNTNGTTIEDQVNVPAITPDHSYGRIPDGTGSFIELTDPTPGTQNVNTPINNNPAHENVTINEIQADNASTLRANIDNNYYDWIELANKSASTIDLSGLKIADSERVWSFPEGISLPANGYIVVFASGLNTCVAQECHTNFSVSSTFGEVLQLLRKDSTVIQSVASDPMDSDLSFGRDPDKTGNFRIWAVPTPGIMNQTINPPAPNPNAANIVINEVMNNNSSVFPDEDGSFEDWIEFYNKGTVTVNLTGLKLRDLSPLPKTWVFPTVSMEPGEYLVVYCSDKNRLTYPLHTNFKLSSSGEAIQFLNLDNSIVSSIPVPALDPDTTYGRLPDGTGAFRVFLVPTPESMNEIIDIEPNPLAFNLVINEASADWENAGYFADEDGTAQDWIEIYNKGNVTVNLDGLKLRDSGDVWTFPNINLQAKKFLIVFASDKDRTGSELHANFRLESNGEILAILNTDSSLVQQLTLPPMASNQSYATIPDGGYSYRLINNASPKLSNGDTRPPSKCKVGKCLMEQDHSGDDDDGHQY